MVSMLYTLGGIFALLVLLALGITIYRSFSGHKIIIGKKTAVFCYIALCVQFLITATAFVIYRQNAAGIQHDSIIGNGSVNAENTPADGTETPFSAGHTYPVCS